MKPKVSIQEISKHKNQKNETDKTEEKKVDNDKDNKGFNQVDKLNMRMNKFEED